MSQIDVLNSGLMPGLADFNRRAWCYPNSSAFLHWFFRDSPRTTVLVAHDQGRWLSVIGVFRRLYLLGGVPVECGETFAWQTARDARGKGLGVRLIKEMINSGLPLVALGGSADTLNSMPRVGFRIIDHAPALNLPLAAGAVGGEAGILALSGAKSEIVKFGLTLASPVLMPRPRRSLRLHNVPLVHLDEQTLAMPSLPGLQATYEAAFFRWLSNSPLQVGTFLPFRFLRNEELVGWAFARIADEGRGQLVGRILELKFAPEAKAGERKVMVRLVAAGLAGLGAVIIRALTTCAETNRALRALGFMSRLQLPAMIHPAGRRLSSEPTRLSMIRADGALLPIPPRIQNG